LADAASVIGRRALTSLVAGAGGLAAGLFTLGLAAWMRRARSGAEAMDAGATLHEASPTAAPTGPGEPPVIPAGLAGITDAATGLFNEQFFAVILDKRVSAARRGLRPLSVVLLEVVTGLGDGASSPADPKAVAGGLLETLRDADTACRLDDGRFAVMLEDTPESGAVWTVERVRRRLAEQQTGLTTWAGVACYPAHAFDASHILAQAGTALTAAKDWHQDRIEVAAVPDD